LFSFLKRRRNLRIALSAKESFANRNAAIYALAGEPHPAAIDALRRIAGGPDDVNLRRSATSRLASMATPDSVSALLDLLAAHSASAGSWVFIDACHGLSWNTISLQKLGDAAVPPIVSAGKQVLAWRRSSASERNAQAASFRDILAMLDKLATPAARSARAELVDTRQRERARELPALLKTALESGAFEEAESAIAEIAELGTPDALAALMRIRRQPERPLDHHFETDNPDVESGYSPKWVSASRRSSELGESLTGEARIRWEKARTG
jgi:HEAT repeat protein